MREDKVAKMVQRLRTEVDCRIEHGAEGHAHLCYVRAELDDILRAALSTQEQGVEDPMLDDQGRPYAHRFHEPSANYCAVCGYDREHPSHVGRPRLATDPPREPQWADRPKAEHKKGEDGAHTTGGADEGASDVDGDVRRGVAPDHRPALRRPGRGSGEPRDLKGTDAGSRGDGTGGTGGTESERGPVPRGVGRSDPPRDEPRAVFAGGMSDPPPGKYGDPRITPRDEPDGLRADTEAVNQRDEPDREPEEADAR